MNWFKRVLLLQLQHYYCSCSPLLNQFRISNYPCVPSFVIINELHRNLFNLLPLPALCLKKVLQLQQQCCSCSSSTLLNQFRLSNYLCVLCLVIINELLPELFKLLHFLALCLDKVLQLQQWYCSCSRSTLLNQFRTTRVYQVLW